MDHRTAECDSCESWKLPIACLVHSGKKSLHAIVRVDAADFTVNTERRVDYLYHEVCQKKRHR